MFSFNPSANYEIAGARFNFNNHLEKLLTLKKIEKWQLENSLCRQYKDSIPLAGFL